MTSETRKPLWDTSGWRVLPQEGRGGDAFGLTIPEDDATLKRAIAGKHNPAKDKWTRVAAGKTARRVPATSVTWLRAKGWIEPVRKVVTS